LSVINWINSLNDDYLIQWANKGLLRRGQKLLDKLGGPTWVCDLDAPSASIDGYSQTLTAVGFESLRCSCSAMGACPHLMCFILGLKIQFENSKSEPLLVVEKDREIETPVARARSQVGIEKLLAPWLIQNENDRLRALGKSNIDQALRWIDQGIEALVSEDAIGLKAIINGRDQVQLLIPRDQGLSASLCQCNKDRCAHRALTIIQLGQAAGFIPPAVANKRLDNYQLEVIKQLQSWLDGVVLQGLSGVSRLQINQGKSLTTELHQVDIPNLSRLTSRMVSMLEQEANHQLISSPSRLRGLLAQLFAHISALHNDPLTQPLLQLVGQHRRHYYQLQKVPLIGLGFQLWHSLTGAKGYSAFFYAPKEKKIYTLTEARNKNLAKNWNCYSAFRTALIGGNKIRSLISSNFILECGWQTKQGDLSSRQGVEVRDDFTLSENVYELASESFSVGALLIALQLEENPYRNVNHYGVVPIEKMGELQLDRESQKWWAEAQDRFGIKFTLVLADDMKGAAIVRNWQAVIALKGKPQHIFGQWRLNAGDVCFEPITLNWLEDPYSISEIE
jgi:hypothetical protein